MNADELTSAIEEQDCPVIVLGNGDPDTYALDRDIQVNRAVRVMGNPAVLPQIDGSGAVRSFTVGPGGFLELQFVRIRQGGGQTRDRYGLEGLHLDSTRSLRSVVGLSLWSSAPLVPTSSVWSSLP